MKIAIATWAWETRTGPPEPGWYAPVGSVCCPDLRAVPDGGLAGTYGDWPWSLFLFDDSATLPADAYLLGEGRIDEVIPGIAARNRWRECFGRTPDGDTVADWLWWQLTDGADPTGDTPSMPIVPTHLGISELHVQLHSLVRSEAWGTFTPSRAYHRNIQQLLRRQIRELLDAGQPELAGRTISTMLLKFRGMRAADIHPDAKPRQHGTDYTDNFNRANESPIAGWTAASTGTGVWGINSNQAYQSQAASSYTANNNALSSADVYSQVTGLGRDYQGPATRIKTSATANCYCLISNNTTGWLLRRYSGTTLTEISNSGTGDYQSSTGYLSSDGSTHTGKWGGSQVTQQTDATYSTGSTAGMFCYYAGGPGNCFDNWSGGDFVASAAGNPWHAYANQ